MTESILLPDAREEADKAYIQWLQTRVKELEKQVHVFSDLYEEFLEGTEWDAERCLAVPNQEIYNCYALVNKMNANDADEFFKFGKAPSPVQIEPPPKQKEEAIDDLFTPPELRAGFWRDSLV